MPEYDEELPYATDNHCSEYDQSPQQMFNSEILVNRKDLYESGFRRDLIKSIEEDKRLSLSTKRSVISVVKAAFDKTVVLSNLKNPDIACIDLDIILNQARAGYSPADISVNFSPIGTYEDLIRQNFNFYISRATGKDRERRLQNLMEHKNEIYQQQEMIRPKEEGRGFNFFRKK